MSHPDLIIAQRDNLPMKTGSTPQSARPALGTPRRAGEPLRQLGEFVLAMLREKTKVHDFSDNMETWTDTDEQLLTWAEALGIEVRK